MLKHKVYVNNPHTLEKVIDKIMGSSTTEVISALEKLKENIQTVIASISRQEMNHIGAYFNIIFIGVNFVFKM